MRREKSVMNRSKKIVLFLVLLVVFGVGIPCGAYCKNKMVEKNMPPMEDVYFVVYEGVEAPKYTIIYKYDAEAKETSEIGRVPGYFHNCEIDSKKEYIIGLRGSLFNEEKPGEDFGVVRFSLADGASEVILSDEKMKSLEERDIHWPSTYICDDGKQVFICYYNPGAVYFLYDLTQDKTIEIDMPEEKKWKVCDIRGNTIWYVTPERTIISYNMETGERTETAQNMDGGCSISDDGSKVAFFSLGDSLKRIRLYDVESGREKCILKAGWNKLYRSYEQYSFGWDKSGNYFFYVELFSRISCSDKRVKVYNLQTGKSECIYKEKYSTGAFEFVRNADL